MENIEIKRTQEGKFSIINTAPQLLKTVSKQDRLDHIQRIKDELKEAEDVLLLIQAQDEPA